MSAGGFSVEASRETIHLLVPAAHKNEAERIVQRYHAEVIEARELAKMRRLDALVNPPEPS
jgi:hypothetical protein